MLKSLQVKNFAIIEDISVEFNNNMTVLTGETGAGKSLIIDTISLLLGARADSDMVRYGTPKATIIGTFDNVNEEVAELLSKYDIKNTGLLEINREITAQGKSTIKINGTSVTLQILKQISSIIADIHVQNDTTKLFNPENYLSFLDPKNDAKFDKVKNAYSKALFDYLETYKEYNHILTGAKEAKDRLEFLEFERDELSALNLYDGIDTELEEKISKLENYDKIFSSLSEAYNELENEYNPLDKLYEASKTLENVGSYSNIYNDYASKLLDCYYIADEIKSNISSELNNMDYDEDELNSYIESLEEINKAKDKYKKSVVELMEYLKKITLDIEMITNYDEVLEQTKNNLKSKHEALVTKAKALSELRVKLAEKLSKSIVKECIDLDLEQTEFIITFEDVNLDDYLNKEVFKEDGVDIIDFKVSFNKGEPPLSLHKVASGGEMSRMMLAFKSCMSKSSSYELMVFDEIDTGVSGATAKKIANKMAEIANSVQVLCITHLPQVAAIGKYHKHIYKELINGRTITHVKDLNQNERVEEIALMLSGDKMSLYALEHAKSLLNI